MSLVSNRVGRGVINPFTPTCLRPCSLNMSLVSTGGRGRYQPFYPHLSKSLQYIYLQYIPDLNSERNNPHLSTPLHTKYMQYVPGLNSGGKGIRPINPHLSTPLHNKYMQYKLERGGVSNLLPQSPFNAPAH